MKIQKNLFAGKNIFITGITGFVGKNLAYRLTELGAHVYGIIHDHAPAAMNPAWCLVHGNTEDVHLVRRIIDEYDIHLCFHLAARSIVSLGNINPLEVFETNVRGTWNIFEACCSRHNPAGVVFASSDMAYGDQDGLLHREDTALLGDNIYDSSKVCGECIARAYHKTFRLPVGVARCANIYGPGDLNFSRIIPETIKQIVQEEPIHLRSNGKFHRDYLYIDDAVNAYLKLGAGVLNGNITYDAFNFGTGFAVTVENLVKKILELAASRQQYYIINNSGKHEIRDQALDIKKAETILEWLPEIALDEGLARTIKWYREYFQENHKESMKANYEKH